jgi:hypothetical protein
LVFIIPQHLISAGARGDCDVPKITKNGRRPLTRSSVISGPTTTKEVEMALSDDLSKLTARAKEAEERAAAGREKAKADLEADRDNARAVGEQQAEPARKRARAPKRLSRALASRRAGLRSREASARG